MPKEPPQRRRTVPFDLRLRPARKSDINFAETLYLRTMVPLLSALGLGDEDKLRVRFERGYRPALSKIIMVQATDIGWMQLSKMATGQHLDQLHLVAEWRDRGIGSYLIERMLHRAGKAGFTVTLDVIRGNPAFALYQRLGFRCTGTDEERHKMLWQPTPGL